MKTIKCLFMSALVYAFLLMCAPSFAEDLHEWIGGGGNDSMGNATNWTYGSPHYNDDVRFGGASSFAPDSDTPGFTFNDMTFLFGAYTVTGAESIGLTGQIMVNGGYHTFAPPISLQGGTQQDITIVSGAALELNGQISGMGSGLNAGGAGTLILGESNTYSGGTTVSGGSLVCADQWGMGGSMMGFGGPITVAANGTILMSLDAVQSVTLSSGTITTPTGFGQLFVASQINVQSGTIDIDLMGNPIMPLNTSMTKTGVGTTVTLSGINDYEGGTTVSEGTLTMGAGGSIMGGPIAVAEGAVLKIVASAQANGTSLSGAGTVLFENGKIYNVEDPSTYQPVLDIDVAAETSEAMDAVMAGPDPDGTTKSNWTLSKTGSGTLTLNHSYDEVFYTPEKIAQIGPEGLDWQIIQNCTVKVQEGKLVLGANNAVGDTMAIDVSYGAVLDMNGMDPKLIGLTMVDGSGLWGAPESGVRSNLFTFYTGDVYAKLADNWGSGSGMQFQKLGMGTVTLHAANSFTGDTWVTEGTLKYGIDNAISAGDIYVGRASAEGGQIGVLDMNGKTDTCGEVVLRNGGEIRDSVGGGGLTATTFALQDGTISLNLTGVTLEKTSEGTVTLTGTNSFSNIIVNGGWLSGTLQSLPGNIQTAETTVVSFEVPEDGTYTGTVSGGGTLVKYGAGALTLTAPQTFSSTMLVDAGTLRYGTASTASLADNVTLQVNAGAVFDMNDISDTIGDIRGEGTVDLGSATLTLAGVMGLPAAGFDGDITGSGSVEVISGGTLMNNGVVGVDVTVYDGGALAGTGSMAGTVTILDGGMLSPGNSPGTKPFEGDLILGGITYLWEINATADGGGSPGQDPGWDLFTAANVLTITADLENPVTFELWTLGDLTSTFNPAVADSWLIGSYASLSSLPGEGWYAVNTANFYDGTLSDALFTVNLTSNQMHLVFAGTGGGGDVPEPSTLLLLLPFIGFGARRLRRKK